MKSPKKTYLDWAHPAKQSDLDGKPLQKALLLEYDRRADLLAFAPSACEKQSDRVAWLSQALSCAMLGEPASITCLPLIDREPNSVINPMTQAQPEITLGQEGLLNAFPFLKDIKVCFEAFEPGDNPLLLMLAGVRQSDALDREYQHTYGQPDTAKFAMQCMAEQLSRLKPGFCAFDAYRLTDLVRDGIVVKDEWQTFSVMNQLHHLARTYPDVHFKIKACMDDPEQFARSFEKNYIPQGVELYFGERCRAKADTALEASEDQPEHHFKNYWRDDAGHGKLSSSEILSQDTVANIYQSMQVLLSASDFEKGTDPIKRIVYDQALDRSWKHVLDPKKHQMYEQGLVVDIISNLSKRKTTSSSIDNTGRMRRLDTLKSSMNAVVDSLYTKDSGPVTQKDDRYRKRLAVDAFLQDMVKFSYDNPDKKIHGGSIRDVQSEVEHFTQKLCFLVENGGAAKRKR